MMVKCICTQTSTSRPGSFIVVLFWSVNTTRSHKQTPWQPSDPWRPINYWRLNKWTINSLTGWTDFSWKEKKGKCFLKQTAARQLQLLITSSVCQDNHHYNHSNYWPQVCVILASFRNYYSFYYFIFCFCVYIFY